MFFGESWEISGIEDNCSVVNNGHLAGNSLNELIDIYMDDLIGSKTIEKFDHEFPLLIKYLDVNDLLSLQVHPNDKLAEMRHNSLGKTEMWYVVQAEENANVALGFNKTIDKDTFIEFATTGRLNELLNIEKANDGDAFFIPAGLIHGGGKGLLIAEIQQTSDITYRVSDWNRIDKDGQKRDLHIDLALDALNYDSKSEYRSNFNKTINELSNIAKCEYFATNILTFDKPFHKDYSLLDSFVVYMCIDGSFTIQWNDKDSLLISKGTSVLIPAIIDSLILTPINTATILEIYVP